MKRQCPNCESMDVKLNSRGQLVCFTCFNIFSTDSIKEISARATASHEVPPFPEELERKHLKRKGGRSDSSSSQPYKRVVA